MSWLPQFCSKSPITGAFPDHTLKTSASSTGLLLLPESLFSRYLVNVNVSHDAFSLLIACMLHECKELSSPSCSPKTLPVTEKGFSEYLWNEWFYFCLEKVYALLQPHTFCSLLQIPRDPEKWVAARCLFCSTKMFWLHGLASVGSTSLSLSRQAAHAAGSYVNRQRSYSRGVRRTHLPGQRFTCSFCICSIWWRNLQTTPSGAPVRAQTFPKSN